MPDVLRAWLARVKPAAGVRIQVDGDQSTPTAFCRALAPLGDVFSFLGGNGV